MLQHSGSVENVLVGDTLPTEDQTVAEIKRDALSQRASPAAFCGCLHPSYISCDDGARATNEKVISDSR
jgi:hypothetical protein